MSFRPNDFQQIRIEDSFLNLTERKKKSLKNSWAEEFSTKIFPAIDENPFSVLYSEKDSRPNTPVNVIIGALIIKELFDLSDDELVDSLAFDLRFQYALHTTSFEEQPLSDKTLTRFRKRCYNHEDKTGIDLYYECIKKLSGEIAKIMGITGRTRRMDSMMIDSNIRRLTRIELIYQCISRLAIAVHKENPNFLPDHLKHYTDPNDYNQVIYYQHSTDAEEVLAQLFADGDTLLTLCQDSFSETDNYKLLERCFSEQTTVESGERKLRSKNDPALNSSILQNPTDPEATYRTKAGQEHIGYVGNVVESVGENGSVVTDYQFETNTHSDSSLMKGYVNQIDPTEEKINLVADGAYAGSENTQLAEEKNINLITTSLTGKDVEDTLADFEFDENGTEVLSCPAGYEPQDSHFSPSSQKCTVHFSLEQCGNCPNRDKCKASINKKNATVKVSKTSRDRAATQRKLKSEEYKNFARLRNGIETVPSSLRRNYNLDKLPRGKQRGKFFFGSKIAALNFRKLFNFQRKRGHYAQNPVIA